MSVNRSCSFYLHTTFQTKVKILHTPSLLHFCFSDCISKYFCIKEKDLREPDIKTG